MSQLFRKKSMDRVNSPEQLNDYVRVANPGVWLLLVAIAVLLIGACVWGVFGRLDTRLTVAAVVTDGSASCYIKEGDIGAVRVGQTVLIGGGSGEILSVSASPVAVAQDASEYALHIGGLRMGEWVYIARVSCDVPDGVYEASVTIDSVSPMSFVFN